MQPLASYIVQTVDYEIASNTRDHYTEKYFVTSKLDEARLVIRRGTTFRFNITFQREYNRDDDIINLVFRLKGKSAHDLIRVIHTLSLYA